MSQPMHQASVPVFNQMCANMLQWLDKAEAFMVSRPMDEAVLLQARLYPDMLPLVKQIQIASDNAKGCASRLAGIDVPKWEDNEASIADLRARLQRTMDHVTSVHAADFANAGTREISLPRRDREPMKFNGTDYLHHFALPNFMFHASMTYAILRHLGVPLGKEDFLRGGQRA